jgi:hypothetical protein
LGVALALAVPASLTVAVIKLNLSAPRDWPFVTRAVQPQIYDFVHSDPRYRAIIKTMGLPRAY